MAEKKLIAGIDIGGTKLAVGMFPQDGPHLNIIKKSKSFVYSDWQLNPKTVETKDFCAFLTNCLCTVINELPGNFAESRLSGLGICTCGIVNQRLGILEYANAFPKIRNFAIAPYYYYNLSKQFPTIKVTLENDANAAGFGEALFGAGRGSNVVVYLTISTGVGGAIIMEGALQRGAFGKAGEFGGMGVSETHIDQEHPKEGVLSKLASGTAIAKMAKYNINESGTDFSVYHAIYTKNPESLNAKVLAQGARMGHPGSRQLFHEAGKHIGFGISSVINIFDPDCIVLGGGLVKTYDLFSRAMFDIISIKHPSFNHQMIKTSEFGDDVGTYGAAAVCMQDKQQLSPAI